ncbi:MAG: SPFH domain-containing protein [Phycisphaerales bacterium]
MRRPLILVIAIVFALALLAKAVTYTVRFTEAGVLTTFGKASEQDLTKVEPGLKFKWPDPIQSVTKYDRRSRFLQTRVEQLQTSDNSQIVVEAFCTWRVKDPLRFFQTYSSSGARAQDHYDRAQKTLYDNLRSALGQVSRYSMGDLFTTTAGASKLGDLEKGIYETLTATAAAGAGSLADYGVEVTSVGINRIILPESTTTAVFDSMKADRERLIKAIDSKGDSEAQRIITTATSSARKIEAFAEAYAAEIRSQGNREAEQYVKLMNESPELAVFLKKMDFVRDLMARRITMVLNPSVPGMDMSAPTAERTSQGTKISGMEALMGHDSPERATQAVSRDQPVLPVNRPAPTPPAGERQ